MSLSPEERAIQSYEELFGDNPEKFERKFLTMISGQIRAALKFQAEDIWEIVFKAQCEMCEEEVECSRMNNGWFHKWLKFPTDPDGKHWTASCNAHYLREKKWKIDYV